MTKGSYTQCQRMNNIHHALYYLQPHRKMLPVLWQLFRDKTFKVQFGPQQQWHNDKRKGIIYTQCQKMNNILYALYYLQPQGKMLPTLWRLFRDKTFKVHFEPKQRWHIDKRKLRTVTEDEQDPTHLCTTYNHRGRCCLLYGDFSGTKRSRYILNYNNNGIMTKGGAISYTHCQRMNNIHHALYIYNHRGRCWLFYGNFSGTKRSRYILN